MAQCIGFRALTRSETAKYSNKTVDLAEEPVMGRKD